MQGPTYWAGVLLMLPRMAAAAAWGNVQEPINLEEILGSISSSKKASSCKGPRINGENQHVRMLP